MPQYLFLDIAQSRASFNQLWNLFSFTKSGTLQKRKDEEISAHSQTQSVHTHKHKHTQTYLSHLRCSIIDYNIDHTSIRGHTKTCDFNTMVMTNTHSNYSTPILFPTSKGLRIKAHLFMSYLEQLVWYQLLQVKPIIILHRPLGQLLHVCTEQWKQSSKLWLSLLITYTLFPK